MRSIRRLPSVPRRMLLPVGDGTLWAIDGSGAPHIYDPIADSWQLHGTGLDAAVTSFPWLFPPVYFNGSEVLIADGQHAVEPIATAWPQLPKRYQLGVKGAVAVGEGTRGTKFVLFRGGTYLTVPAPPIAVDAVAPPGAPPPPLAVPTSTTPTPTVPTTPPPVATPLPPTPQRAGARYRRQRRAPRPTCTTRHSWPRRPLRPARRPPRPRRRRPSRAGRRPTRRRRRPHPPPPPAWRRRRRHPRPSPAQR